jgi:hypothetical protein
MSPLKKLLAIGEWGYMCVLRTHIYPLHPWRLPFFSRVMNEKAINTSSPLYYWLRSSSSSLSLNALSGHQSRQRF